MYKKTFKILTFFILCVVTKIFSSENPATGFPVRVTSEAIKIMFSEFDHLTQSDKDIAYRLIDEVYEKSPRAFEVTSFEKEGNVFTERNIYGKSFCLNPEILYQEALSCKGKTIMEIGASRAEMSLLLGLAGAEKVIINDLNSCDLQKALECVKNFSESLRSKFSFKRGDCRTLLKKIEESSIDFLIARNVIHYLLPSEYPVFLGNVNKALKPSGRIFVTSVNNINNPIFKLVKSDYDPDVKLHKSYLLETYNKSNTRFLQSVVALEPTNEQVDITYSRTQGFCVFPRSEKDARFYPSPEDQLKKIEEEITKDPFSFRSKALKSAVSLYKEQLLNPETGTSYFRQSNAVFFSPDSLVEIFNREYFNVVENGSFDCKGHKVNDGKAEWNQLYCIAQKK